MTAHKMTKVFFLSFKALNQLEKVKFLSRIVDVVYSSKEATVNIGYLDRNSVLSIYGWLTSIFVAVCTYVSHSQPAIVYAYIVALVKV